ncbi:unnamed protein product [Acidithrix sp. C25]|nr:unnamed protein product [Acidithrix sp. C25]
MSRLETTIGLIDCKVDGLDHIPELSAESEFFIREMAQLWPWSLLPL